MRVLSPGHIEHRWREVEAHGAATTSDEEAWAAAEVDEEGRSRERGDSVVEHRSIDGALFEVVAEDVGVAVDDGLVRVLLVMES